MDAQADLRLCRNRAVVRKELSPSFLVSVTAQSRLVSAIARTA